MINRCDKCIKLYDWEVENLCEKCKEEYAKESIRRFDFKDDIEKVKQIADKFGIVYEELMHDRERSLNKKLRIIEEKLKKEQKCSHEIFNCLDDAIKAIKIMARAYDDFDELCKIEDKWGELLVKCKFIEKKNG